MTVDPQKVPPSGPPKVPKTSDSVVSSSGGATTSKENNGVPKTPSKKPKGEGPSKTPKHDSGDIIGGLDRGVSTRRQLVRSQSERNTGDSTRQRHGRMTRSQSDRNVNG